MHACRVRTTLTTTHPSIVQARPHRAFFSFHVQGFCPHAHVVVAQHPQGQCPEDRLAREHVVYGYKDEAPQYEINESSDAAFSLFGAAHSPDHWMGAQPAALQLVG